MRSALMVSTLLVVAAANAAPPHLDPGRPPAATLQAAQVQNRARAAAVAPALDSEAERLLHASFDAADSAHRGTLSRAEAQAGGFGWIANHFDALDTRHAGRVSFDDVRAYLKRREANPATN